MLRLNRDVTKKQRINRVDELLDFVSKCRFEEIELFLMFMLDS